MSRTLKGNKGSGYEYWGRRAFGSGKECSRPGRFTKKMTHKMERRTIKKELDKNWIWDIMLE